MWSTLPTEIWVHVFSFIDINSLFPCMLLSHHLHEVFHTPSVWRQLCLDRFKAGGDIEQWEDFQDFKNVYQALLQHGHLLGLWRMVSVRGGLLYISGKGSTFSGCALSLGLSGDEDYVPALQIKLFPSLSCTVRVSSINPFYQQALRHFSQQLSPELMEEYAWKQGRVSYEHKDTLVISPWTKAFIPAPYYPPILNKHQPSKNDLASLCGLWKGIYGGHGWEVLSVIIHQDQLIGMKMVGDPNVPAGEPSWWTPFSADDEIVFPKVKPPEANEDHKNSTISSMLIFEGHGRIAEGGYINPQWVKGRLYVWNKDSISFTWRDGAAFSIKYSRVKEPSFWA